MLWSVNYISEADMLGKMKSWSNILDHRLDTLYMPPFTSTEIILGCYKLHSKDFSSVYFKMTQRYQAQVQINKTLDS